MNQNELLSTFFFAYQRFSRIIDLNKYNLSKNQHRILFYIYSLNHVSIKKILEVLDISKQAFNILCRNMINRGLIKERKSEQDKRIKILELTNKGTELIQKINDEQFKILKQIFNNNNNDWQKSIKEMSDQFLNKDIN